MGQRFTKCCHEVAPIVRTLAIKEKTNKSNRFWIFQFQYLDLVITEILNAEF